MQNLHHTVTVPTVSELSRASEGHTQNVTMCVARAEYPNVMIQLDRDDGKRVKRTTFKTHCTLVTAQVSRAAGVGHCDCASQSTSPLFLTLASLSASLQTLQREHPTLIRARASALRVVRVARQ